uniref:hypothetical protein n=1 Tax=Neorhizobium sp. EC2-8 TaxID=3129230 RepID=UPI003100C0D8
MTPPRSLQPTAAAAPPQVKAIERAAYEQAYAPAIVGSSRLAVRSGAWLALRTGLSHVRYGDDQLPHLARASEGPIHLRLPRPPLLATNDRPRASSHEGQHVAIAPTQSFMLHGPRSMRASENMLPVGLDRTPRSFVATKLELLSPADGVFPPDWDGSIQIRAAQWFGRRSKRPGTSWMRPW